MSQDNWTAVDAYLGDLLARPDAALEEALRSSAAAGLPSIQVSPLQGKLLQVLAQSAGARKVLEIGTLGGYSTIWLGRALAAGGKLITLEAEEKHAKVARANIARAGLESVVEIILGPALQTLPRLAEQKRGPFDLIFIDADKTSIAEYFDWAVKLSRPGSLIVVDNVVRKGAIVDGSSADENVQGVRRFFEMLSKDRRVNASAVQTVGSKGYDGLAIAQVNP